MHQKSFIRWYIGDGSRAMFSLWKQLVFFVPRHFSMALLFRTLFAPWHRDISLKTWRGFSPLRSVDRLIWNVFSRVIGAIVRLGVITSGLVLWVIIGGIGFVTALVYVCAPGVLVVSFVLFFSAFRFVAFGVFVFTLCVIYGAYILFRTSGHMLYERMSMKQLHEQKWFYRVYERIGVEAEDIPYDILSDFPAFQKFLLTKDVTVEEFELIVAWEIEQQKRREQDAKLFSEEKFLRLRPIGLHWHFGYTVQLDHYAEDLTAYDHSDYARYPFHGFDQEMGLIEVVLARPHENNILLTGQAGLGRHMIIHELARRIRTGYFERSFMRYMRFMQCDFTSVMAQAKSKGEDPEFIVHSLFHEAAYAGNIIFVVDNFEQYIDTNISRGFSFTTIIDEYASMESFRMIAIATEEAFHEKVDADQIVGRHFDVIPVHEMDDVHAMKVLFTRFYGETHTPFTYQALRQVITDAQRYTNTAPLPTRAISLAIEVFLQWQKTGDGFITAQTVDAFITQKTGIPVGNIAQEEQQKLLSLEDTLHKMIIGQSAAVQTVAAAVRRMRSGMARPNKPAGTFLFLGPTGVGKTEMAKAIAAQYFGSDEKVVRIDMSEYQGPTAVDRLIGSKELNQKGAFVSAAKEHPYALLLLDEIDKANPRVLDLFLQILDEGFVHDAFGHKISFTSMIIIATSNAGALMIKKMVEMGMDPAQEEEKIVNGIIESGVFRPEFINRFDDVVIFGPLEGENVRTVTQLLLQKFATRVLKEQNIDVTFADGVVDRIIEKGYDHVFGARSVMRYIDDGIADIFAKKLIAGNVHRGETVHFATKDMEEVGS
ncbi:MAG: AAA family ATPase [Parcubacteria group bacterium]|jgi:ATP-dependent Clp protease ATP-binding subunit ClpC